MSVTTRVLTGAELERALPALARLRIEVFRDWPYLYDGDLAYEQRYLQNYRDSEQAILVGAFDGDCLIGAATGTPLADHAEDFHEIAPMLPVPVTDVFYCAESVLLPAYRGRGIGHQFFVAREGFARKEQFSHACFCAVVRPNDHPLRPAGYRSLDPFWRKRGYVPVSGAQVTFDWKDVDTLGETTKTLQCWMRKL